MTFNIEELNNYPKDQQGRPLVTQGYDQSKETVISQSDAGFVCMAHNGFCLNYDTDGHLHEAHLKDSFSDNIRIIGPWVEPKPDYASLSLPMWCWGCAMDKNGVWHVYEKEATPEDAYDDEQWSCKCKFFRIPTKHAPKWKGPWRESKIVNPKYGKEE